jgi:hypothetical protein
MQCFNIRIQWAPRHIGIEGNEAINELANLRALKDKWDPRLVLEPIVSSIRSIFRDL